MSSESRKKLVKWGLIFGIPLLLLSRCSYWSSDWSYAKHIEVKPYVIDSKQLMEFLENPSELPTQYSNDRLTGQHVYLLILMRDKYRQVFYGRGTVTGLGERFRNVPILMEDEYFFEKGYAMFLMDLGEGELGNDISTLNLGWKWRRLLLPKKGPGIP